MNPDTRFLRWSIWGFMILVAMAISGLFLSSFVVRKPTPLPVYGTIPEFTLTNQLGQAVSLNQLRGHVWVADIIFTRCPGPCLQMTRKMKAIADGLASRSDVKLVSLTADPEFDKPPVLQAYAARIKADSNQWSFLTGPKRQVYGLAMNGLKLAVQENPPGTTDEDQFIHSTRFVLVDRQGRLRSVSFDGTDPSTVKDVLRSIDQLLKES